MQKAIEGLVEAALDLSEGVHYVGKPEGWGLEMGEKFTAEDYHHPSDKVSHTVTSAAPPRIGSFSERSANAAQMHQPTQPGKPGRNSTRRGNRC